MKKPTTKLSQRPVHRLAGQWRAQNGETDADYTIEDSPSGICVSGLNTYAGERFEITNVQSRSHGVEFDTFMPSTGRRGHLCFISTDEVDVATTHFRFTCQCWLTHAPGRTNLLQADDTLKFCDRIIGCWRADEDDDPSECEFSFEDRKICVRGKDFYDNEQYEISNVRIAEEALFFDSLVPSTQRKGSFEVRKEDSKLKMNFTLEVVIPMIRSHR